MSHAQGKPFTPEEKKFIVSLKQYFDRNKTEFGPKDSSVQMTADALGIGLASVNRVMASYNKDPLNLNTLPRAKGRPEYAISCFYQEIVRAYIRKANAEGKYITLETILKFLQDQSPESEEFHDRTLARTLDRWGFEFGKGSRIIIMNAITRDGWVPNAKVVFKSNKKTGDYHRQMNGEIFSKWFSEKLLPNIPSKSIIILDNASYHNILSATSVPAQACSKNRILEWLEKNKLPCHPI